MKNRISQTTTDEIREKGEDYRRLKARVNEAYESRTIESTDELKHALSSGSQFTDLDVEVESVWADPSEEAGIGGKTLRQNPRGEGDEEYLVVEHEEDAYLVPGLDDSEVRPSGQTIGTGGDPWELEVRPGQVQRVGEKYQVEREPEVTSDERKSVKAAYIKYMKEASPEEKRSHEAFQDYLKKTVPTANAEKAVIDKQEDRTEWNQTLKEPGTAKETGNEYWIVEGEGETYALPRPDQFKDVDAYPGTYIEEEEVEDMRVARVREDEDGNLTVGRQGYFSDQPVEASQEERRENASDFIDVPASEWKTGRSPAEGGGKQSEEKAASQPTNRTGSPQEPEASEKAPTDRSSKEKTTGERSSPEPKNEEEGQKKPDQGRSTRRGGNGAQPQGEENGSQKQDETQSPHSSAQASGGTAQGSGAKLGRTGKKILSAVENMTKGEGPSMDRDPQKEQSSSQESDKRSSSATQQGEEGDRQATDNASGDIEIDEETRAELEATKQMGQRLDREKDEMTQKFVEVATSRYENPEVAEEAYFENRRRHSQDQARQVLIDPENHLGDDSTETNFADPGSLKNEDARTKADERAKRLSEGIEKVRNEREVVKDKREAIVDKLPEGFEEQARNQAPPTAEMVTRKMYSLENYIAEEEPDKRAEKIEELLEKKKETQELESKKQDFDDLLDFEGDTVREKSKNEGKKVLEARKEFTESLDGTFKNPKMAVHKFNERVVQDGFEDAARDLAYNPESFGEMEEGEDLDWVTKDWVDTTTGEKNAAETFREAPDSEIKKAAKLQVLTAKKNVLDFQHAMKEEGVTRDQAYKRLHPKNREHLDRSTKMVGQAQTEHIKLMSRLKDRPQDQYESQIEAAKSEADSSVADQLREKGQQNARKLTRGSKAMTVRRREQALRKAMEQVYKNPEEARLEMEKVAFYKGIDTSNDNFQMTTNLTEDDLETWGKVDDQGVKEFKFGKGHTDGIRRSTARLGRTGLRVGSEIGEEIVDRGPDEETEEAMSTVRTVTKSLGGLAGGVAAVGAAGAYNATASKVNEMRARKEARKEIARRFKNYGRALESYQEQKSDEDRSLQSREPRMPAGVTEGSIKEGEAVSDEAASQVEEEVETLREEAKEDAVRARQNLDQDGDLNPAQEAAEGMSSASEGADQTESKSSDESQVAAQEDVNREAAQASGERFQGSGARLGRTNKKVLSAVQNMTKGEGPSMDRDPQKEQSSSPGSHGESSSASQQEGGGGSQSEGSQSGGSSTSESKSSDKESSKSQSSGSQSRGGRGGRGR
jgi:hypothetical protein